MRAIPVLQVSNSALSEEFYVSTLGFERRSCYRPFDGQADPAYCVMHRDGAHLHISSFSGDSVPGAAVYLLVDSVDQIFEELTAKGFETAMKPTDQSWGNREMYVEDPDGNSIRFVEER